MASVLVATRVGVIGVYNTATYTDIVLESNTANTSPPSGTGFNNFTAGLTGLSFEATSPNPARQVIGNGLSNSNAILTITGPSTFAGTIQNAVVANFFPQRRHAVTGHQCDDGHRL